MQSKPSAKVRISIVILTAVLLGSGLGLLLSPRRGSTSGAAVSKSSATGDTHDVKTASPIAQSIDPTPNRQSVMGNSRPIPREKRSPPKLISVDKRPDTDPLSPNYSPKKLAMLRTSPVDIFRAEPRDKKWAPKMEKQMQEMLLQRFSTLQGFESVKSVECHMLTCKIKLAAKDANAFNEISKSLGRRPISSMAGFSNEKDENGVKQLVVWALLDQANRDPSEHLAWVQGVADGKINPYQP